MCVAHAVSMVPVSPHLHAVCIFSVILHITVACWHVESMVVGIIGMFFVGIKKYAQNPRLLS